jgi:hypothetical protein
MRAFSNLTEVQVFKPNCLYRNKFAEVLLEGALQWRQSGILPGVSDPVVLWSIETPV